MKSAPFISSLPAIEWQNEAMTKLHASPAGSLARTRITRDLVVAFTPYLGGICMAKRHSAHWMPALAPRVLKRSERRLSG